MHNTTYHRASSVEEASRMAGAAAEAKYVAGGQTLIPAMKTRLAAPSDLIDLRHVSALKGISVNGRSVTIGAATPHAEVAGSSDLAAVCPAICSLASHIGDPHVRHMGTIGGSVANNDPAADYPAAMLGLGATIVTDKREIAADDFFTGLFETALEDGEIITAVKFDAPDAAGYAKFPNPASRYAMTGVFVARRSDGVRVAVTGAGNDGVFRAGELEAALAGDFSASALEGKSVSSADMMSDMHANAEYRANLVTVMAKRAVTAALGSGSVARADGDLTRAAETVADEAAKAGQSAAAAVRDAVETAGQAADKAMDNAGQAARQATASVRAAPPQKKRGWLARLFGFGK